MSDKVADANEERLNGTSERPGRRGDVRATTSLLRAIAQPGSAILCQDVAPLLRRTSAACRRARHGPLLGNVYSHTQTCVGEIVRPSVGSAWCVTVTSPWESEVYTPSRADDRPNRPTNIGWCISTRPPPGCWQHCGRQPIRARRAWCGGPYYGTALRC